MLLSLSQKLLEGAAADLVLLTDDDLSDMVGVLELLRLPDLCTPMQRSLNHLHLLRSQSIDMLGLQEVIVVLSILDQILLDHARTQQLLIILRVHLNDLLILISLDRFLQTVFFHPNCLEAILMPRLSLSVFLVICLSQIYAFLPESFDFTHELIFRGSCWL